MNIYKCLYHSSYLFLLILSFWFLIYHYVLCGKNCKQDNALLYGHHMMLQEAGAFDPAKWPCIHKTCGDVTKIDPNNAEECNKYLECGRKCAGAEHIPAYEKLACVELIGGGAATQKMQVWLLLLPLTVVVIVNILNRM